ncbi:MAG: 3-deoxy-8-phosphooctulonate synthase [Bacteroidetes bacterium]|nr:3-deoxy-8-phosphooctulonate synthase [Bacteroidota bacterium]
MNFEVNQAPVKINSDVTVGLDKPVLFSGPCAAESIEICMEVAEVVSKICAELGILYVFKASFDKANRTSAGSYRGPDDGLKILEKVRAQFKVPVVTDVHESHQCAEAASVVDVLQIPAFLCRQTDLLKAAAKTGKTVKIKKGQFMAPEDMRFAAEKVWEENNQKVLLTERGTTFGYNNLVVDMRSLPIMRQFAPVIFDVTHSVQRPGGLGGKSGGNREFAPYLAKAAAAAGVDGFFIETHPDPSKALSDGPNMIPLSEMRSFLKSVMAIWSASRSDLK